MNKARKECEIIMTVIWESFEDKQRIYTQGKYTTLVSVTLSVSGKERETKRQLRERKRE